MKMNYSINNGKSYLEYFVGYGQCSKELQQAIETEIKNNQAISRVINLPIGHTTLELPIQQQILEICTCCYNGNDYLLPIEVLQLIVMKVIVLVHKKISLT